MLFTYVALLSASAALVNGAAIPRQLGNTPECGVMCITVKIQEAGCESRRCFAVRILFC